MHCLNNIGSRDMERNSATGLAYLTKTIAGKMAPSHLGESLSVSVTAENNIENFST